MKIIIAGAGSVGTHLAKLLARERHDIVLMDEDVQRLEAVDSDVDIMTMNASPSSIVALKEVGAQRADLFIGVTPDEAVNMTCCMLAHKLGTKKTVARVDNYEYTLKSNSEFFSEVGINSLVYPELLAAQEISYSVKRSWVRQWWEVNNGSLIMIGVKVRKGATILDRPLKEISGPESPYHIVAVKRNNETLIPHGDNCVKDGDIAYFMTTPHYVSYIRQIAGKEDYPDVKNIIVMGGGDTAAQTIRFLPDYMHGKIIETNVTRCKKLIEAIDNKNIMVIHGDGRDIDLLEEEGVHSAEAFVALTNNTEKNILACLAAKRLGVRKTVAMVDNIEYFSMAEGFDIGTIINKKSIAASHIYRMMLDADVTNVKSLTVANADVAEFEVKEGMKITKKPVKDLKLPSDVNLGGLVRNGKGILINGMTTILPGDTVVAFCLAGSIKKIEKFFR